MARKVSKEVIRLPRYKKKGSYIRPIANATVLNVNDSEEGLTLEDSIARRLEGGEQVKMDAPLIYTDKVDGVQPAFNIRADRWELAIDALGKIEKSRQAKGDFKPELEVIKGGESDEKVS